MSVSNTRDCFRELIGHTVKGVLFKGGNATLVLDDGTGFLFYASGAYAREDARTVAIGVRDRHRELEQSHADLAEVAQLDGLLAAPTPPKEFV